MTAMVTLKISAAEFDLLRKAVEFARNQADLAWKEAKERGDESYADLYAFRDDCQRLLKHALGEKKRRKTHGPMHIV